MPITSEIRSAGEFKEKNVETVYLKEGEHTLRMEAKGEISIDYLKLTASSMDGIDPYVELTEEKAQELLEKANSPHKIYKNIYMSPAGSDNGDGSEDAPFATLSRAKEEVAKINDDMDGDIVINVMPGTYKISETEIFTEEHGGKNGFDVIIRGSNVFEKPVSLSQPDCCET